MAFHVGNLTIALNKTQFEDLLQYLRDQYAASSNLSMSREAVDLSDSDAAPDPPRGEWVVLFFSGIE